MKININEGKMDNIHLQTGHPEKTYYFTVFLSGMQNLRDTCMAYTYTYLWKKILKIIFIIKANNLHTHKNGNHLKR